MKTMTSLIATLILAATLTIAAPSPATADIALDVSKSGLDSFVVGGEVSLFGRYSKNPFFGGEEYATFYGEAPNKTYGEVAAVVHMTAAKDFSIGTVSARVAPIFAKTIGDDFYGWVQDGTNHLYDAAGRDRRPSSLGIDEAWLKLDKAFGSNFTVTVGNQDIRLEKDFLYSVGSDQRAGYWGTLQRSFAFAVRVDGDFGPLKTTAFWAKSDKYKDGLEDDVKTYGLNLHYDFSETVFVYGGVFKKDEPRVGSSSSTFIDMYENDTIAYDLGADATFGPVQMEAEGVYQTGDVIDGDGNELDRKSYAYWTAATYNFDMARYPYLRATYAHFSGDDDVTKGDYKNFDSMFTGFNDWNRWFIGEIVGEAQLNTNSNKKNLVLEAGLYPTETTKLVLSYIQHKLAETNGPNDWADEVNLTWEYFSDSYYLAISGGYATPGKAAEAMYGNDENAVMLQTNLIYFF
jgi:Alginate export